MVSSVVPKPDRGKSLQLAYVKCEPMRESLKPTKDFMYVYNVKSAKKMLLIMKIGIAKLESKHYKNEKALQKLESTAKI